MLNYGPEADERSSWNDEQKKEEEQKEISKLKSAAQDPLLRRLVTVHILATATSPDLYTSDSEAAPVNRCARWLSILKEANLGRIEDAEYLGWVAYNNGDYKGAAHWLELSKGGSSAALWLQQLQRRASKPPKPQRPWRRRWNRCGIHRLQPIPGNDEKWTEYDYFPEGPDWGWGQRTWRSWRFGSRAAILFKPSIRFSKDTFERCRVCGRTRSHHERIETICRCFAPDSATERGRR
jgi:hypothetical protein